MFGKETLFPYLHSYLITNHVVYSKFKINSVSRAAL